jgi:hypothetical protein
MVGTISLSISTHFAAIVGSIVTKPVVLPPGLAKLVTKPLPIGSETFTKRIGSS